MMDSLVRISKPPWSFNRLHGGVGTAPPSSCFEIRLFYVRIAPCAPDGVPPRLTLCHLRREIGVGLEINGNRIPASEQTFLFLRRDRLDHEASEVTYVSTDSVRLSGAVDFEVCDKDLNLILCGSLQRVEVPWSNGSIGVGCNLQGSCDKDPKTGWSLNCYTAASILSWPFMQTKLGVSSPSIEVNVAGCFAGVPLILTQTIQTSPKKKVSRQGTLDVIPEGEEANGTLENCGEVLLCRNTGLDMEGEDDEHIKPSMEAVGHTYSEGWYFEDDGQLSWFNAGVRVGVGIGLGMCLGIGIGVGLLMRSYQATTRGFRRRFF